MIKQSTADTLMIIGFIGGWVSGFFGYHLMVRHHRLLARQAKRRHPSTQKAFLTIPLDEV